MRWWNAKDGNVHEGVTATLKAMSQNQSYRRDENLRHVRLYGNFDVLGLSSSEYARGRGDHSNRVTFNIIQSCVDTAASKIAKNKPKAMFLTERGQWDQQVKAKKLEQFCAGVAYQTNLYEITQQTFVDAGVLGTGIVHVFAEHGQVQIERVFPDELKVDDAEAIYGKPRSLHRIKAVNRDVLIEAFPESKAAIQALKSVDRESGVLVQEDSDLVEVRESWHLPSGPKADDGRHTITIEGKDLLDEKWKRQRFPFAKFVWNPKLFGFWGQGIAEQLIGIQLEINKLLKTIQTAHHLLSAPAYMVEEGSNIVKSHLSNEIGRILTYRGIKPSVDVFQTIHPEIYQHLERLYMRAYEIIGISQLSAQSKKPAGLDSGKALREFNDIETERFMLAGQRWENYHMEINQLFIETAKDIAESDPDFAVKTKGRKFLRSIKWSEVDMDEDSYLLQAFPVSQLSSTPAGRMQEVQELVVSGLIDQASGMELLDFPDLDSYRSLRFSARDAIREKVDLILDEGRFLPPEPFEDLTFARDFGNQRYNRAKMDGVPAPQLELLRRFIQQAQAMIDAAAAPPQTIPNATNQTAPVGAPGVGQPVPLPEAPLMPAAGQI